MSTLYDVVWREYLRADRAPESVLRASAAWISAPFPVQSITGAS